MANLVSCTSNCHFAICSDHSSLSLSHYYMSVTVGVCTCARAWVCSCATCALIYAVFSPSPSLGVQENFYEDRFANFLIDAINSSSSRNQLVLHFQYFLLLVLFISILFRMACVCQLLL